MNQPQPKTPAPKSNLKWLWIALVIVVVAGALYYYFVIVKGSKTAVTTSPTPTVATSILISPLTPSPVPSPSPTATNLTYTNSQYGFSLVFPATWADFKMKEAHLSGETATFYINLPTKENTQEDVTQYAGYFSPFAIGVYTLAQWAAVEASEGPHDTLIIKNSTYAFGWSHANGIPPDDYKLDDDVAGIIASFKLTQ